MTSLLSGCKSHPLGPYISPRVEGQVLAAETGLPLPGVRVTLGKDAHDSLGGAPPKGGELLMRKAPALTDHEGRFGLASERVLSFIRGSDWNQVRLTFEHPGYERLRTNYPTGLATNAPGGEPVLDVGRVTLTSMRR